MNSYLNRCGKLLIEQKLTIAFAESATAGRMAAEFALLPNAGEFLIGGIVCYNVSVKEEHLKVPQQLVTKFTPESAEVTQAMAKGLTDFIKADVHVAITGLPARGGSETTEKPVGTMFICAFLNKEVLFEERIIFNGKPQEIIEQTIKHTAKMLLKHLQ